jgi:hypothetical protein
VTAVEEAKRQARLVDQMASMHSILRDRAERRGHVLGFLLLSSSFVLLVASTISDDLLVGLGLRPEDARTWGSALSVLLFVFSLLELRLGYGLRAAGHREAADRLSRLKQRYRTELNGAPSPSRLAKLNYEYEVACSVLPPIPEGQFHSLKAAHLRKIQLSKMIDLYPTVPIPLLKLRLLREGLRGRAPQA